MIKSLSYLRLFQKLVSIRGKIKIVISSLIKLTVNLILKILKNLKNL